MKEILEAERFWLDSYFGNSISQEDKKLWMECNRKSQDSVKIMIEFARLHVKAALEAALKVANEEEIENDDLQGDCYSGRYHMKNCYPLEAIK